MLSIHPARLGTAPPATENGQAMRGRDDSIVRPRILNAYSSPMNGYL